MPTRLQLELARKALSGGGVVAYPTEAVWGLGCDPLNQHAVQQVLELKRRLPEKGFILIASDFEQLAPYLAPLSAEKLKPALRTWPGPNTWVLPAASGLPWYISGGRQTIAVRVTANPTASALCRAYGGAIISTSANVSGHLPARTALQVRRRWGTAVDYLLPGETDGRAQPTPIRDLVTGTQVRA